MSMDKETPIVVYGVDHSPWVQGVLIALQAKNLPYRIRSLPLSLRAYRRFGLVMPICRWPDGSMTTDSFAIMTELERRYPTGLSTDGLNDNSQRALEGLFLSYVMGRIGGMKVLWFATGWSAMPSGEKQLRAGFFRAFMYLYFFLLIIGGRSQMRKRGFNPDQYDGFGKVLSRYSPQLGDAHFLGGKAPGYLDFALFGHIQCMLSGLTDETRPILLANEPVQKWIDRMATAMPDYRHDFSKRLDDPSHWPKRASLGERAFFWLGLCTSIVVLPLTIGLLIDGFRRRAKNAARSGGKMRV